MQRMRFTRQKVEEIASGLRQELETCKFIHMIFPENNYYYQYFFRTQTPSKTFSHEV